jgi:similar to stage IV sporulation protein
MAKNLAREDIKRHISEEAIIKGEKILHETYQNGNVNLTIHFQVIEDIAKPQPIIQGD